MRRLFICLIILVFWGFISAVKADPLAVARAWIDWSGLEIYTDEGVSVSWGGTVYFSTYAYDHDYREGEWDLGQYWYDEVSFEMQEREWDGSYYFTYYYEWYGDLGVSISMGRASAEAGIDYDDYYHRTYTHVKTEDGSFNEARAQLTYYGSLEVSGSGYVTFRVPYHIEGGIYGGKSASVESSAWLFYDYYNYDYYEIEKNIDDDGIGFWNTEGFLELSIYLDEDNSGYLEAGVYSYASSSSPVPLPSALWFFGSGLFGVAGFRKFFGSGRKHS